jgi:DNA ligase (NAD+)
MKASNDLTIKIEKALRKASQAYYNTGETTITDEQFDKLKLKLQELDPNNSFLKEIGAPIAAHLEKVKHTIPMGSLNNCSKEGDKANPSFAEWHEKRGKHEVCIMHKLDGSSIELIYKEGKLTQAITRGDGEYGEDVTQNARKFKGIPTQLTTPFTGSIRGEALLLKKDFEEHFTDTANPRNAANGTVRRSDGDRAKHITFIPYDCITENLNTKTHNQRLDYIDNLGFTAVWRLVVNSTEKVVEIHDKEGNTRDSLPYEIDGLVIRVNDDEKFKELGERDNRPKGGIAYKFQAMEATTKLLGVKLSLGHTGAVYPTADLAPVQIGGVTVTSALLNNYEEIERLGIAINDEVKVVRRGDVIPKVEGLIKKAENRITITPPDKCWHCDTTLIKDGVHIFCKNEECKGKLYRLLKSWIDKRGILHIGDELLTTLYENYNIKEPADLYKLNEEILAAIPRGAGVVGSNAVRIMAELEKSKECPLNEFVGSLGIKFLGRRQAEIMIEQGINTLNKFTCVKSEDLTNLEGFSKTKAEAIVEGLQKCTERMKALLDNGVKIVEPSTVKAPEGEQVLTGRVVCFTGVRPTTEENNLFIELGGSVKSGVSKNLTHLVVKDIDTMSNKAQKAKELGVELIDYNTFLSWLTK